MGDDLLYQYSILSTISLTLAKVLLYCRYCAGTCITKANFKTKDIMDKTLEPQVAIEVGSTQDLAKLSLKGGHISKIKSNELTIDTTYCTTCRNIDAGILSKDSLHLEIESANTNELVIIPHSLAIILKTLNLEPKELTSLVHELKSALDGIYKKWQLTGRNPCKKSRTGKEVELQIKNRKIVKL